jgi:pyruvate,water dikinase
MTHLNKLNGKRLPNSIGNKARNLHQLAQIGMRTPETLAVRWDAYHRYLEDDVSLVNELRNELTAHLNPDENYAVRSSANIEDNLESSFAGQFKSVLNVKGVDSVFQAIWSIWGTANSESVRTYLEKHDISENELAMAVMIQKMVKPVFAGVALSRNPVTGADEIVVEAVEGSGDALVQTGVTPYRWIYKWGTYIAQSNSKTVPKTLIDQIIEETSKISEKLNSHVDLEWVFDGEKLYWLQVREITTLAQRNVYSNNISKELLPGMIKPLISTINIPMVCSMWVRLLNEMVGKTDVKPEDLARPFYYRVYFNMGALGQVFEDVGLPRDSVEMLMGYTHPGANKPSMKPTLKTLLRLPYLLRFFWDKWFFENEFRKQIFDIQQQFERFDYLKADTLEIPQLFDQIDELFGYVQKASYYNIVGPLLMGMYNRVLEKQLAKYGVEYSQFDLAAELPDLDKYDPNFYLHSLHKEFISLDEDVQEAIRKSSYAEFLTLEGITSIQLGVSNFLERFGQFSDNGNDFSETPWRESPGLVLDLILNFTPTATTSDKKIRFSDLGLRGLQRARVGLFYRRARDFRLLREQISASYTYGYGLFRYFYLAVGKHLVKAGILDDPQDVFYLSASDVRQLATNQHQLINAREIVANHKSDMKRFENIPLPAVIYGDTPPPIQEPSQEKLVGVPTSIGHYTGKVTVVNGIKDFNKVQQGDVLVIPYSDVGWTPLFARAGAVVAESGGLLSHSSIVAREYNIPAIVSVVGATQLQDNTLVTVNGHNGEVFIHNGNKHGLGEQYASLGSQGRKERI